MKSAIISRRSFLRRLGGSIAALPIGVALAPALVEGASAAQVTLKLSSSLPNDPKYANGRVYYDLLLKHLRLKKVDDRIAVSFFPDNQLGQEIDVANQVKFGVVDLMVTGTSIWANLVPVFGVLDLGYIFQSFEQQTRALAGQASQQLEEMLLAGANTRVIGWGYNFGSRSFLTKSSFKEASELRGMKIRTLPNPVITEVVRLMGAAATPMAFGEIYTALQAGVLDGVEHDPPTILASKFYETAKYYTLTKHIFSALGIFMSDATYKRMPLDLRESFLDAAKNATIDERAHALVVEKEALEELNRQGVTISDCDRQVFRNRVQPLWERFTKQNPQAKPVLDLILATPA
jgi:TRAP-type transport system periplasmic protein